MTFANDGPLGSAAAVAPALHTLRGLRRECVLMIMQRMRIDAALGAYIRSALGWSLDKSDKERNKIAADAMAILRGKQSSQWDDLVAMNVAARLPFEQEQKRLKGKMADIVESLPIWTNFARDIRGLGAVSLGVILAEAGDPFAYKNRNNLWKRLGIGVVDGVRQGSPGSNASKEDWIRHGYNRQRRSAMWNIGDCLIKGNADGRYRAIYLNRKELEKQRNPEIRPIVAHRRAQRYMEQRLIADLRREWIRLHGSVAAQAE